MDRRRNELPHPRGLWRRFRALPFLAQVATAIVAVLAVTLVGAAAEDDPAPPVTNLPPTTVAEVNTLPPTTAPTTTSTVPPTTTTTRPPTTVTTAAPATTPATRATPTTASSQSECHPSYVGACVPVASDVDCGGGSGNGPAYVYVKRFRVVGPDVYGLDSDGDGIACES